VFLYDLGREIAGAVGDDADGHSSMAREGSA
jgi:hypothetical protein